MSVQRWDIERGAPAWVASKGEFVKHADHARIVAEAGAAVFAFHPEWTVTGMCDSDCLACRRLTELITEREKGYEEGKADAEQAHAAALAAANLRWDAEVTRALDEGAEIGLAAAEQANYEQGFRDGMASARAAVVAEAESGFYTDVDDALTAIDEATANGVLRYESDERKAAAPRTLTADDPEPAVTSVGLDRDQSVWQRVGSTEHSRWVNPFMGTREWSDVLARGPVRLIHDGEATP